MDTTTRGIRGAVTVSENDGKQIVAATRELLAAIVRENKVRVEDICTVIFSVTRDLDAEFPAIAARQLGWIYTPLLCTNEIPVPGSLPLCVRVLLLVNTARAQEEIIHVYLGDAQVLRPDLDHPDRDHYYKSLPGGARERPE